MKWAKVVNQSKANNTLPQGVEIYYAFRTGRKNGKAATICGHYTTAEEAEIAAHAYRCGKSAERLVCEQTKRLMKA